MKVADSYTGIKGADRERLIDENGVLLQDTYFKTPSAAGEFVCGGKVNGWTVWRTEWGGVLSDLRNKDNPIKEDVPETVPDTPQDVQKSTSSGLVLQLTDPAWRIETLSITLHFKALGEEGQQTEFDFRFLNSEGETLGYKIDRHVHAGEVFELGFILPDTVREISICKLSVYSTFDGRRKQHALIPFQVCIHA